MIRAIIDFHIHSRYSRACSAKLTPANLAQAARIKGIDILGTGDFTHPKWLAELKQSLVSDDSGLFKLKDDHTGTKFILTAEVACIYKQGDRVRRIHHLIVAPNFEAADKIIAALNSRGCNLKSDGRPIIGLKSRDLLQLVLEASDECLLIPAHAWTPHFGIFGSGSGFDSLEECFGDLADNIYAIETGLSADPPMHWRMAQLDRITLISNSDAHSLENLGREANVMEFTSAHHLTYDEITRIIRMKDKSKFLYTLEFYPEEGKYHLSGHLDCGTSLWPEEVKKEKNICPKCKKKLTGGVLDRVEALADAARPRGFRSAEQIDFKSLVPLREIIAEVYGVGKVSKKVVAMYEQLTNSIGSEFDILLFTPLEMLAKQMPAPFVEAIARVRQGQMHIEPGYDGKYGVVKIFSPAERKNYTQKSLI